MPDISDRVVESHVSPRILPNHRLVRKKEVSVKDICDTKAGFMQTTIREKLSV